MRVHRTNAEVYVDISGFVDDYGRCLVCVWERESERPHAATHEKHAGQVRGDEGVHSARSTDEHRVAVKNRRRQRPWDR